MPKPEILDPQGKAVLGALPRLGFSGVSEVRQGKRFELEVAGEITPAVLAEVEKMAESPVTPSNPWEKVPGSNSTVVSESPSRKLASRQEWPKCVSCMAPLWPDTSR